MEEEEAGGDKEEQQGRRREEERGGEEEKGGESRGAGCPPPPPLWPHFSPSPSPSPSLSPSASLSFSIAFLIAILDRMPAIGRLARHAEPDKGAGCREQCMSPTMPEALSPPSLCMAQHLPAPPCYCTCADALISEGTSCLGSFLISHPLSHLLSPPRHAFSFFGLARESTLFFFHRSLACLSVVDFARSWSILRHFLCV